MDNEYDSPAEDEATDNLLTSEQTALLNSNLTQSISDSAKTLPIAKHKTEII